MCFMWYSVTKSIRLVLIDKPTLTKICIFCYCNIWILFPFEGSLNLCYRGRVLKATVTQRTTMTQDSWTLTLNFTTLLCHPCSMDLGVCVWGCCILTLDSFIHWSNYFCYLEYTSLFFGGYLRILQQSILSWQGLFDLSQCASLNSHYTPWMSALAWAPSTVKIF
jgi:hypothetical protein